MRFKLLIPVIFMLILMLPLSLKAALVPWDNTTYSVFAQNGEDLGTPGAGNVIDSVSGPAPPVSAYASYFSGPYSMSEIMETTMHVECNGILPGKRCFNSASFTGTYIASAPFFMYTFNYSPGGFYYDELEVTDLTLGTTQVFDPADNSGVLYIPTPVGHEIEINLGVYEPGIFDTCCGFYEATLTYEMAIAPEPISSTLFIVGGATLGIRRFLKKK